MNFPKFPQKTKFLEKFELLAKKGFEFTEKRKARANPLS